MHHIGVFDSGLGGLTVLKALVARLPEESFLYLGDLARLPYGTKSPEVVQEYARRCVAVLESHDVKGIVVACNTATASALPQLRKASRVPVWGVIEAGVTAAAEVTRGGVLVLATEGTVRSQAYVEAFRRRDATVRVEQIACPLLVPLVEEGWFDHEVTKIVLREYLSKAGSFSYDTILLGCTHYPLLEKAIRSLVVDKAVVHGGSALAAEVEAKFPRAAGKGALRFLVTDRTASSARVAESLFGRRVELELISM